MNFKYAMLVSISAALVATAPILAAEPRGPEAAWRRAVVDGAATQHAGGEAAGVFDPTLFLFDNVPGGVGLSERAYQHAREYARTRVQGRDIGLTRSTRAAARRRCAPPRPARARARSA